MHAFSPLTPLSLSQCNQFIRTNTIDCKALIVELSLHKKFPEDTLGLDVKDHFLNALKWTEEFLLLRRHGHLSREHPTASHCRQYNCNTAYDDRHACSCAHGGVLGGDGVGVHGGGGVDGDKGGFHGAGNEGGVHGPGGVGGGRVRHVLHQTKTRF